MSFGETLQKLRKQKGWSQEELAERLELTRQTVSKWELEQSTPDLDYIIELCDLFQVSADYLIRGEEYAAEKQGTATEKNEAGEMIVSAAWVIVGAALLFLGVTGIIGFMVLATVSPASALIDGYSFEGLLGYLLCNNAVPYFALCVLLALAGAALYVFLLIKRCKQTNVPQ